jgi:tRNA-specific 2-thiouridylase
MKKIVVAMSGGVDSSVAALVLREQGYEVIGVSLRLYSCGRVREGSCCTERDRRDAAAVCDHIAIAHRTVDLTAAFRAAVVEPFVRSYLRGETPSPCILCNEHLKFRACLDEARRLGAPAIATGHYARILRHGDGSRSLARGVDRGKDQSYFLYPLLRSYLACVRFPVGELTKGEVRAMARAHDLPVHDKGESQEVCFVPDNDYGAFIEEYAPGDLPGPGRFIDADGNELGRHRGIHNYTVGQRRGLGIGFGSRKYVVRIDASTNDVVLGDDEELTRSAMVVRDAVWACRDERPRRAVVQIRSTHRGSPAVIEPLAGGRVRVTFDAPERAIAPGQAAVFYDGDEVVGGGTIG